MRVLIAGCGYVGGALAAELVADGHEVFGLRRGAGELPAGVVPVVADLSREVRVALPAGVEAVCYAVAPDEYTDDAYRLAYVEGPRLLLAALAEAGSSPRRILFSSSTAVYGQSGGEWVDEESETRPPGFSGRRLLEAEAALLGGSVPATIVRFGGIYGPGRTRLLESVRRGEARLRPGGPMYTNRIHRDDCAGALRHLLLLDEPASLYLGVDCEPAEEREVLCWLARAMGVAAPLEGQGPAAAAGLPLRPRGSKRCANARLLASGYRFRFPTYREGYAALLGASAPR